MTSILLVICVGMEIYCGHLLAAWLIFYDGDPIFVAL